MPFEFQKPGLPQVSRGCGLMPYPHFTRIANTSSVKPWDFGILLMNAAACFVFVVAYLYKSAIPRYHNPVFESGVDFTPLRWPTVVFIANYLDQQGLISVSPSDCQIWDGTSGDPIRNCSTGALSYQENTTPQTTMLVLNASLLSPENQTVYNLAVEMSLAFKIICKLLVPFRLHSSASLESQITPRPMRKAGRYTLAILA